MVTFPDRPLRLSRILLVDSDSYTSSLLIEELSRRGFDNIVSAPSALELPGILTSVIPDAVVFNFQSDRPESLTACSTIRLMAPRAAIIALVSPGPALRTVRSWSSQTRCIDAIVEKPLSDERFFATLEDLLRTRVSSRALEKRAEQLANLVPEGAISAIEGDFRNEAELFEAAVIFTDIRGSSQLIRTMPPREFFRELNQLLSAHAKLIGQYEGSVIKYTGDGVMALFRGMGKSYLALRCALELAGSGANPLFPFGTGVAEGLVLAGLIGDSNRAGQRRQYDVVGATVHLAARLCSMASAGQVVAVRSMNAVSSIDTPAPRHIGRVAIRGFGDEIECMAFDPSNQESGSRENEQAI